MSYSLRDLPLPVKVVASVFLLAVGAGYTSAMVQLHMQDAKSGKPMPTVDDVIRKYTGKKKFDPNAPPPVPVSRLEALVTAEPPAISGQSMSAAFTTQDPAKAEQKFNNLIRDKLPEVVEQIKAERKGEQTAFKLWINAPEEDRRAAYAADKFVPPAGEMPKALTPAFLDGNAVKIKSIIDARCVQCHSKGGDKEDVPLDTYDGLAKFMGVSAPAPAGDWVKVEEPISVTKLTQSTHAHLLSFAMLFSLTGLLFALTDYPVMMRVIGGPWVVIAVVADVSLWWLARLCDQWGPYFAMAIIGTGGVAGAGLFGQIVLSLFNMYGRKGKVVIGGVLIGGGVIAALMWLNVFEPGLRAKAPAAKQDEKQKPDPVVPKKDEPKIDKKDDKPRPPSNELDRLLTLPARDPNGQLIPLADVQFNGQEKGNMAKAFFENEKQKVFKNVMADPAVPQAAKDKLKAERQGELDAVVAWVRAAEAPRKAAYDADRFEVPPELAAKVTSRFVKDGRVQIKALIDARCASCHAPDQKQEEYPLDTYEGLSKYLKPLTPDDPVPPKGKDMVPAPPAPKPADPIPDAKDD